MRVSSMKKVLFVIAALLVVGSLMALTNIQMSILFADAANPGTFYVNTDSYMLLTFPVTTYGFFWFTASLHSDSDLMGQMVVIFISLHGLDAQGAWLAITNSSLRSITIDLYDELEIWVGSNKLTDLRFFTGGFVEVEDPKNYQVPPNGVGSLFVKFRSTGTDLPSYIMNVSIAGDDFDFDHRSSNKAVQEFNKDYIEVREGIKEKLDESF